MKNQLNYLRNLVCYCGLTKEEYSSVKRDAYVSNYRVWKIIHVLMVLTYATLFLLSFLHTGMSFATYIRLVMFFYSVLATLIFFFQMREDGIAAQFLIYVSMVFLLMGSFFISLDNPMVPGVAFVTMLVFLPMLMIDKPYFMITVLIIASCVYLGVMRSVETAELFRTDKTYVILACCIGILVNTFYNYLRVREISLNRNEKSLLEQQRTNNIETKKLNIALNRLSDSLIDLLGDVVESRDTESGEHIRRVKGFANILARQVMNDCPEYDLDNYTVNLITSASPLHDVGKIFIPDSILLYPGRLSKEQFELMKTHCERGGEIIEKMANRWAKDFMDVCRDICLYHHEKWDGRGYPKGLSGDDIPIAAQIVSIADCYDALTTKRVYKDAFSYDQAFIMICNGECGTFSPKLLACFTKCREKFERHAAHPEELIFGDREYEVLSRDVLGNSFVIGFHDQDKNLRDKLLLGEEVSVLGSLSESFYHVCYVNMKTNSVARYKVDKRIERIINTFDPNLPSNMKYDKLLNTLIVSEDYDRFREDTNREKAMDLLKKSDHLSTDFRIRLADGIHHCRMRITPDPNNPDAVIIGIFNRDEEHAKEVEYINMQQELAAAVKENETKRDMEDRLAVIDSISREYDYVCTLNAVTMETVVYRAEDWIKDMFKNITDIVVSPEARETLKGIIVPEDFDRFQAESAHSNVMRHLQQDGSYSVNYRGYKYGKLVYYQTKYELDKANPWRIIIGLREINSPRF